MNKPQRLRQQRRTMIGMSLVEVLVASAVLLIIALGAASVIPIGFQSNQKSKDMAVANQAVSRVMEEVNSLTFNQITAASPEPLYPTAMIDTRNYTYPGQKITINGVDYPRKLTVDKKSYRVDLLVYKGVHDTIAALPDPVPDSQPRFAGSPPNIMDYLKNYVIAPAYAGTCNISANAGPYYTSDTITFTGSDAGITGNPTYTWNFGDTQTDSGKPSITHVYAQPNSNYQVTLAVKKGSTVEATCSLPINVAPAAVTIDRTPTGNGYLNTTNFTFNALNCNGCGASAIYRWNFGSSEGPDVYGNPVTHKFQTVGSPHTVTLTVESGGAPQATNTVTILQSGVILTVNSTAATVAETLNFSVQSGDCTDCGASPTYTWDFGDFTGATGSAVTHSYTQPGSYTASVQVTGGSNPQAQTGISVSASHTAVIDIPQGTSGAAGEFSDPQTTQFYFYAKSTGFAGGTPVTYTYDLGTSGVNIEILDESDSPLTNMAVLVDPDPSDATYPYVKARYKAGGSYSVTLNAVQGGDTAMTTGNMNLASSVDIAASPGTTIAVGDTLTFTASGQGLGASPTYTWNFGDGGSVGPTSSTTATHTYTAAGNITVTLSVSGGSNPSATKVITVQPTSTSTGQHVMKKIFLKVAEWSDAPPTNYIATFVSLKAENEEYVP